MKHHPLLLLLLLLVSIFPWASTALALDSLPPSAAVADPPAKPQCPPQFVSSLGMRSYELTGNVSYDEPNKRMRMDVPFQDFFLGPNIYLNTTYYYGEDMYYEANGVCRELPSGEFASLCDWVASPIAKYYGKISIQGRECDEWILTTTSANLTLCVNGSYPVRYTVATPDMVKKYGKGIVQYYFGPDLTPAVPDPSIFSPPATCTGPTPVCPNTTTSTNMTVFVFHPKDLFNISNEDVADLEGDVTFVCYDAISNNTEYDKYAWISQYTLEVDPRWGQYGICNGYPGNCFGGDTKRVGREASYGVGQHGSQCNEAPYFGFWYSLPGDGECRGEQQKVGVDCSWRIITKVKTIDGQCLFQHGFKESCVAEKQLPFTKTKQIFATAFESADPSSGGCPPIAS